MRQTTIKKRFEEFLRKGSLKVTPQRKRIFDRVFSTHEHFSAERLYEWLRKEEGPRVSRATVYRTLDVLVKGAFIESLDTGTGELMYEHILGHHHHDHMICLDCGKIEEFRDERIEELQRLAAEKLGFQVLSHVHRLSGYCRACGARRQVRSRTRSTKP